jgi:hypothetical protein
MKKIFNITLLALLSCLTLASCEGIEDFIKKIDGTNLVYVNVNDKNTVSAQVLLTPTGVVNTFSQKIPILCNNTSHGELTATLVVDNSLIAGYNQSNSTAYKELPAQYLNLDNPQVSIPDQAYKSDTTVNVSFKGNLEELKDGDRYLVPLRVQCDGMDVSTEKNVVYCIVNVDYKFARAIGSLDEMAGDIEGNRTGWTANIDNDQSLFDNDDSHVTLTKQSGMGFTVDMKSKKLVTGIQIGEYYAGQFGCRVEYSTDGTNFTSMGLASASDFFDSGWGFRNIAFYGPIEAQFIRLTFEFEEAKDSYGIKYFNVFTVESKDPVVLFKGNDNPLVDNGYFITHVAGSSDVSNNVDLELGQVKSSLPVTSSADITAEVDNSLVASYNSAHGTQYETMPMDNIDLSNTQYTIEGGKLIANGNAKLKLKGDLSNLKSAKGYLIPVKLTCSSIPASATKGVKYILVQSEETYFMVAPSLDNVTRLTDYTGWIVKDYTNGNQIDNLFTGTGGNQNHDILIDLGKKMNISAMGFRPVYAEYGYFDYTKVTKIRLLYSDDGKTFTSRGTSSNYVLDNDWIAVFVMSSAINTRYLRIQILGTGDYYQYWGTDYVAVYGPK